eukprot:6492692-Amphidinium_carterae.2
MEEEYAEVADGDPVGAAAPAAAPAAVAPHAAGGRPKTSLSSVKLDRFNGARRSVETYRSWKKSIQAHVLLHQLTESETAMLIYLATEGEARGVLDVLTIPQMTQAGGLPTIWQILDDAFGQSAPDRFEHCRAKYENCRRLPGQSMEAYIAALKRARLEWLAEDAASSISDKAYAAKLLSGSGLTSRDQKQIYYLSLEFVAGSAKVEELLRVMYPAVADIERRAGRTLPVNPYPRRPAPSVPSTRPSMSSVGKSASHFKGQKGWKLSRGVSSAHVAEGVDDGVEEDGEEGTPGEEEGQEQFDEDEQAPEDLLLEADEESVLGADEEALSEEALASAAFAAGWSAKAKTAEQRKARGFAKPAGAPKTPMAPKKGAASNSEAIARRKARSLCAACGQQGHWKGDACCPKGGNPSSSRVHFVGMAAAGTTTSAVTVVEDSDHHGETLIASDDQEDEWERLAIVSMEPPPDHQAASASMAQGSRARLVRRRQDDEEEEVEAERHLASHQRLLEEKRELETRLVEVNRLLATSQTENKERLDRLIARRQAIDGGIATPQHGPLVAAAAPKMRAKRAARAKALAAVPLDSVPREHDASSSAWRTAVAAERRDEVNGRLRPSARSPTPTEEQATCLHPTKTLQWGSNSTCVFARCGTCTLKHVLYFQRVSEVLVAQKRSLRQTVRDLMQVLSDKLQPLSRSRTNVFEGHLR